MRVSIAGATGFIGRRLAAKLLRRGHEVRCLARDPSRADELKALGCEVVEADLTDPDSLAGDLEGIEVAYYLVHMMKGNEDFAEAERGAAHAFARAAKDCGVRRVIYLGGLGDDPQSEHLRSRQDTARILRAEGPPLTYFRAGIVIGAESDSFLLMRDIAERLPVRVEPHWLDTRTQPIGVEDIVEYLAKACELDESQGREIQVGGPDVLTYAELLDEMSLALGKEPPPKLRLRGMTPEGTGAGAAAVTGGDESIAAALTESLSTETIVTDPSGAALFDVDPEPVALCLSKAVDEHDGVVRPAFGK